MTVIGSILHTHLTGVSIFTKIVRNGKDVPLFGDVDYDFNYQQLYFLSPYVNITKVNFFLILKTCLKFGLK
jgi:hypothetical protein